MASSGVASWGKHERRRLRLAVLHSTSASGAPYVGHILRDNLSGERNAVVQIIHERRARHCGFGRGRKAYLAVLKIPEPYRLGVSVLANLPESSYNEILHALSRAPSSFVNPRELVAWVMSEAKGVSPSELTKLVSTLTSLYRLRSRQQGTSIETLANDVAIAARDIPNLKVAEGVDLASRLSALLALDSLNTIALKAKELQEESERTYCGARIITDVRPVFGESLDDSPTMIIVHTLKLGFHDSTPGHKDIYVALDASDIAALRKTLERAEEKAKKLKIMLEAAKLPSIDLT